MAERKPVVFVGGQLRELPAGDTLPPQTPATHSHATSDVAGLDDALAGKEPAISAGTTAQYWRGDKTWRDFFTDVRAATLTGMSTATNAVIDAADTVLVALGKLQAQVSAKANSTEVREKLTAARTYYVRTDGNDSNNGLTNTAGGAFLTIQKAVDVCAAIDLGIYDATIMVGAGTWTAATTLKTTIGAGNVIIRGVNDDLTSTVISVSGSNCFGGAFVGRYKISHMRMTCTGVCIDIFGGGAIVRWADVDFAAATVHVRAFAGALGESAGNYTISGSAYGHITVYDGGNVRVVGSSVTITGTPNFNGAFCVAGRLGNALIVSAVFSGSATGARYSSGQNSVIYTGAGELYLPGDAAGVKATGGHYE